MVNRQSIRDPFRRRPSIHGCNSRNVRSREQRSGVAAVEFAVCLPVLLLLVFGSIEASSMIFLKQSLNVAAYESTREAIRDGRSNADAEARARAVLDSRGIVGYRIEFPNGESLDADRAAEVITSVTASSANNSPLLGRFLTDRQITVQTVMLKQ
ncbi:pilus assembly protein [Rhodopirellula sp. JC740]|uniref:Pilus assembly protein n=1 Tax=Rhodopirellula halodulae TaxID=2894198 RepID=A0ABS8NNE8_9BACT|nr:MULTISPECIES: TadE/TadG family type IV pilus assembly protein [unclassified Rhodopirellula]MCC9644308.1 pilus assembly protein [Rhodopirellula sp. JC740]MCC9657470.1 pilus assembly protein [Rhodopirellula sp. JC737]